MRSFTDIDNISRLRKVAKRFGMEDDYEYQYHSNVEPDTTLYDRYKDYMFFIPCVTEIKGDSYDYDCELSGNLGKFEVL